jgi:hypothetical protein
MSEEKTPDNLIQLPTSGNQRKQEQQLDLPMTQKTEAQQHELVLQLVEKNRFKGLENVEKRLDNLESRKTLTDAGTEEAVHNLTGGLRGAMTTLEALNSLVDFIKHDLVACIQNLEQQGRGNFQASAHLQTLLAVLKEKGIVDETELKAAWEGLMANVQGPQPTQLKQPEPEPEPEGPSVA